MTAGSTQLHLLAIDQHAVTFHLNLPETDFTFKRISAVSRLDIHLQDIKVRMFGIPQLRTADSETMFIVSLLTGQNTGLQTNPAAFILL